MPYKKGTVPWKRKSHYVEEKEVRALPQAFRIDLTDRMPLRQEGVQVTAAQARRGKKIAFWGVLLHNDDNMNI